MTVAEFRRLGKAIILNKWMVLVAAFMVMISAGGVYDFGIYSQSLKLSLGYDQQTLNTLSFFKDIGTNVGVLGGILYDWKGPPLVFLIGAVLNVVGNLMIWMSVTGRIARPHVWHMCLYFVISSSWTAFINTACIVTCVRNFPLNRGMVVGLLKGSLGLGGAILALLFRAIYGDNTQSFILLLSWFPTAICFLLMPIIRIVQAKQLKTDTRNFYIFLAMILTMAGYLMITIIIQDVSNVSRTVNQIFCVITFLLLLVPLFVVIKDELKNQKASAEASMSHLQTCGSHVIDSGDSSADANDLEYCRKSIQLEPIHTVKEIEFNLLGVDSVVASSNMKMQTTTLNPANIDQIPCSVVKDVKQNGVSDQKRFKAFDIGTQSTRKPFSSAQKSSEDSKLQLILRFVQSSQRGMDLTPAQALFNLNLWILFIASTCGIGSQLMVIDNLGQIGASLRYSQTNITTCVSLVSIWNCLGRVGAGFISEYFIQRKAFSRPWFLAVALIISAVGHTILASDVSGALYISSIIIGVCYGAEFTLIFTTISEISGLRFYATIFNVVQLSSPLGLYILSVRTAGLLYDQEARKQLAVGSLMSPSPSAAAAHGALICNGRQCYRTTFFIMTVTSVIGAIFASILAIRTRWLYRQLQQQHLDHHNDSHVNPIRPDHEGE